MQNETNEITIGEITTKVANASTDFEMSNTDLKRKYLLWNIEAFNIIASSINVSKGSFGTGYPFYALNDSLEGTLPIIEEQKRYNRQLIVDGRPLHDVRWLCKNCIGTKYFSMPDLKQICTPCPNVPKVLKPRKLINRLPDLDMWIVVEDGCSEDVQEELIMKLSKYGITSSDIDPIKSIDDVYKISQNIKENIMPKIHLPMDAHIMEYTEIKRLIEQVPDILNDAKEHNSIPYLPIHPVSYRKMWQHDDAAYNYIYDFLSAFTSFNFEPKLQEALNNSRARIANEHTPEELFDFLLKSATDANFRRFQSHDLEKIFYERISTWKSLKNKNTEHSNKKPDDNDEPEL